MGNYKQPSLLLMLKVECPADSSIDPDILPRLCCSLMSSDFLHCFRQGDFFSEHKTNVVLGRWLKQMMLLLRRAVSLQFIIRMFGVNLLYLWTDTTHVSSVKLCN